MSPFSGRRNTIMKGVNTNRFPVHLSPKQLPPSLLLLPHPRPSFHTSRLQPLLPPLLCLKAFSACKPASCAFISQSQRPISSGYTHSHNNPAPLPLSMSSLQSPPQPWERPGERSPVAHCTACCSPPPPCSCVTRLVAGVATAHQSSSMAAPASSPRAASATPAAAAAPAQSPVVTSPYSPHASLSVFCNILTRYSPHALAPSAFSPALYGGAGGGGYGMQVARDSGALPFRSPTMFSQGMGSSLYGGGYNSYGGGM